MGYTHFDKVDGVNGLYVGAKGSETQVASTNGLFETVVLTHSFGSASIGDAYVVSPIAGTVAGNIVQGGAAPGVPGTITATVGSAGAVLLTGTQASAGSAGTVTAMTNSSGTTTIDAGASIRLQSAASGTAYLHGMTISVTRTA